MTKKKVDKIKRLGNIKHCIVNVYNLIEVLFWLSNMYQNLLNISDDHWRDLDIFFNYKDQNKLFEYVEINTNILTNYKG